MPDVSSPASPLLDRLLAGDLHGVEADTARLVLLTRHRDTAVNNQMTPITSTRTVTNATASFSISFTPLAPRPAGGHRWGTSVPG